MEERVGCKFCPGVVAVVGKFRSSKRLEEEEEEGVTGDAVDGDEEEDRVECRETHEDERATFSKDETRSGVRFTPAVVSSAANGGTGTKELVQIRLEAEDATGQVFAEAVITGCKNAIEGAIADVVTACPTRKRQEVAAEQSDNKLGRVSFDEEEDEGAERGHASRFFAGTRGWRRGKRVEVSLVCCNGSETRA